MLLLLASCQPSKRLQRILAKHPELLKTDTVYKKVVILDTVRIKATDIDTFFLGMTADTSRNTIKKVLDVKKDSITVRITQAGNRYNVKVTHPGNIIPFKKEIEIPLQTQKIVIQPTKKPVSWKVYVAATGVIIFFLLFLGLFIFKRTR